MGDGGNESQLKSKREDVHFNSLLLSMAQNTGMHGLPNITRSRSIFRKICWLLILFGGIGICHYFYIINQILLIS